MAGFKINKIGGMTKKPLKYWLSAGYVWKKNNFSACE